jgi:hypothetical protein
MDLLIHISAPTSKKDDDRYRAQALAYLDFDPAVTHRCEHVAQESEKAEIVTVPLQEELGTCRQEKHQTPSQQSQPPEMDSRRTSASLSSARRSMTPEIIQGLPTFSTPLQRLETIQALWKSCQRAAGTARTRPNVDYTDTQLLCSTQLAVAALETQVNSHSSGSLSFTISSPLQKQATKRRRVSKQSQAAAPPSSYSQSPHTSGPDINQPNAQVVASGSNIHTPERPDLLSSQLPETYELSKSDESVLLPTSTFNEQSHSPSKSSERIPPKSSPNARAASSAVTARSKSFQIYRSAVDDITQSTTRTWSSQPSPMNLEKENIRPLSVTQRTVHLEVQRPPDELFMTKQSPLQQTKILTPQQVPANLLQQLRSLPKQILPPKPPTSSTPVSEATFITDILQSLANQEELWKRYNLNHQQSRPISRFERGHWRLNARNWPLHHQIKFWRQLMQFVGNGRVGLATSCFRQVDDAADGAERSLGIVKVFCWGEIVMHVWLFLYTLTRSDMSRSELGHEIAAWIDVDGITVVTVP